MRSKFFDHLVSRILCRYCVSLFASVTVTKGLGVFLFFGQYVFVHINDNDVY